MVTSVTGLPARRAQQYKGAAHSDDLIVDGLERFFWEVKGVEQQRIQDWMTKAKEDCGNGKSVVVLWKQSNRPWLAIMDAEDFLKEVSE